MWFNDVAATFHLRVAYDLRLVNNNQYGRAGICFGLDI